MSKWTESLYEDNPNKSTPLRINRLKSEISLKVIWQSVDGRWKTDWFVPNTKHYIDNYHSISDFHICEFPEESVREFLQHCPIHNTQIEVWRES